MQSRNSWFFCLVTALVLNSTTGCIDSLGIGGWDTNAYRKAIRSGRSTLTAALEMENQFSNTEHILIMYGATGKAEHEWHTISCFGGRYELTMIVDVVLNTDGTAVLRASEPPTFILWVCQDTGADGGGATFDSSREQKFGLEKWTAFKESGFDLKLLDPSYDGSVLEDFDEYANAWQKSRRIWRSGVE